MSIQHKIDSRTEKLQAILADANTAIIAKSGTAAANLSGIPAAIEALVSGDATPNIVGIDVSAWSSGKFSETLETGDTFDYGVEFDASQRPIEVTLPTGDTVAVKWEASEQWQ